MLLLMSYKHRVSRLILYEYTCLLFIIKIAF
nr:MAG TPA: PD-(D/E)XK nuclease superfamily protein [Bacteriophage sp.]